MAFTISNPFHITLDCIRLFVLQSRVDFNNVAVVNKNVFNFSLSKYCGVYEMAQDKYYRNVACA